MTIASDLLRLHIETFVADITQWQMLIADDLVWELPYAPAIGHPARLSGREAVVAHVTWFLGAVEKLQFFDIEVHSFADPEAAVARFKAEALIKLTGRTYRQEYVLFLRAEGGRSHSFGNISIRPPRPRRWTRRFWVSTVNDPP